MRRSFRRALKRDYVAGAELRDAETVLAHLARHPRGHHATQPRRHPAELAGVVAFRASPRASYVPGAIVAVDDGRTAIYRVAPAAPASPGPVRPIARQFLAPIVMMMVIRPHWHGHKASTQHATEDQECSSPFTHH